MVANSETRNRIAARFTFSTSSCPKSVWASSKYQYVLRGAGRGFYQCQLPPSCSDRLAPPTWIGGKSSTGNHPVVLGGVQCISWRTQMTRTARTGPRTRSSSGIDPDRPRAACGEQRRHSGFPARANRQIVFDRLASQVPCLEPMMLPRVDVPDLENPPDLGPATDGARGESPGGISPPGARRTGREPRGSSGSHCPAVRPQTKPPVREEVGFTSSDVCHNLNRAVTMA